MPYRIRAMLFWRRRPAEEDRALRRDLPRKHRRAPHPTREDVEQFLERISSGHDPLFRLRLHMIGTFYWCGLPCDKIRSHARDWGLSADKAEELLRGDLEWGFRWPTIEAILFDCGADPAHIEIAHDLFHEFPRTDRLPARADPAGLAQHHHSLDPAASVNDPAEAAPDIVEPPVEETESELDSRAPAEPADSYGVRSPNPASAQTAEEFLALMREYRVLAGQPSFRVMSKRVNGFYAHSTFAAIGNKQTLPGLPLLAAYIEACEGDDTDVQAWKTAWQRLALKIDAERRVAAPPAEEE